MKRDNPRKAQELARLILGQRDNGRGVTDAPSVTVADE
jgi:hypothetical protein